MGSRGDATPALVAFATRLGKDLELRKRIDGLTLSDERQTVSDIVWIASEAGFFFSAEELVRGWRALVSAELGESELEAVTGGARDFELERAFRQGMSSLGRALDFASHAGPRRP